MGGQHDGHLPFWLPGFVKLITLLLHVLFACWNKYTTTTTTTTRSEVKAQSHVQTECNNGGGMHFYGVALRFTCFTVKRVNRKKICSNKYNTEPETFTTTNGLTFNLSIYKSVSSKFETCRVCIAVRSEKKLWFTAADDSRVNFCRRSS